MLRRRSGTARSPRRWTLPREPAGRLATITGDPPKSTRGIGVSDVYVRPDTAQLEQLCALLRSGRLSLTGVVTLPLAEVAAALERPSPVATAGRWCW